MTTVLTEPNIVLDVMARLKVGTSFQKGSVLQTALDVCSTKMKEKPVVIILKSLQLC